MPSEVIKSVCRVLVFAARFDGKVSLKGTHCWELASVTSESIALLAGNPCDASNGEHFSTECVEVFHVQNRLKNQYQMH